MKKIPKTEKVLVLRTDFSDDNAWELICAEVQKPVGIFRASVDFVSDPAFNSLTAEQLLSSIPENPENTFIFIVDREALRHPDHPILVMDLDWEPGRTFRVIPSQMWGIENNLPIGNMDFEEFADSTDPDGIFRGFPGG